MFGATDQGEEVGRYILSYGQLEVEVISWGATLAAVRLAGADLVLGFDDMAGYTSAPGHGKAAALTSMTVRQNSNFLSEHSKLHNKLSNLQVMRSITTAPCQETKQIVNIAQ